ncbi:hypothetical protein [Streptomyces spectabilis]|uniref:Uncharacterized protein n=1 Tax=Streptomyces spectabilis TaxID=68270 RepID=A0A7W8AQV6_STRST|nr:hypothetical protein [Streptomyces spectabilis]MBB5102975.1 hypothetical protein [Streptomyces spectabilis]MCI3902170.1 hypothetical protein [Streptomyces spectabilis]
MADLGGGSRAVMGSYKAARFGARTWTQRQWFKYLLYKSVLLALMMERPEVENQRVREAAQKMCRLLRKTPVPMERDGFTAGVGRFFRKFLTWGIRYPDYRGPLRDSYQQRLHDWAKLAAQSGPGLSALEYAQFSGGTDPAETFARRFQEATGRILHDASGPASDAQNYARDTMLHHIDVGLTEAQIQAKLHNRNAALRSAATGAASATLSALGFHNDWYETVGLAAAGSGASLTLDYGVAAARHNTRKMIAARRQALTFLLWMLRLLTGMRGVTFPEREIEEDWGEYLVRGLHGLVREDSDHLTVMLREFDVEARLSRLIETAERANDEDLDSLLTDFQTALDYPDMGDLPNAVRNLLFLLRGVSLRSGNFSQPEIGSSGDPLILPPNPDGP